MAEIPIHGQAQVPIQQLQQQRPSRQQAHYTVTVTGLNGCTASATTAVTLDGTAPTPSISGTANLTCAVTSVTRTASGGSSYSWSGPSSYSAATAAATITAAGTYTVTVTGINGCTASATTAVTLDGTAPTPSILGTANLGCSSTSVTRTASGGISYSWSGPNSFSANTAEATISLAGTYSVTVTAANGCTAIATTEVTQEPSANITFTSQPSNQSICEGNSTSFTVAINTSGNSFQWQVKQGETFVDIANTSIYSGVNTPTVSLNFPDVSYNANDYRCKVMNGSCEAFSESATLNVQTSGEAQTVVHISPISSVVNSQAVSTGVALNKNLPGSRVDFKAGNSIEMLPGFVADTGSVFSAKIESACPSNTTSFQGSSSVPKEIIK